MESYEELYPGEIADACGCKDDFECLYCRMEVYIEALAAENVKLKAQLGAMGTRVSELESVRNSDSVLIVEGVVELDKRHLRITELEDQLAALKAQLAERGEGKVAKVFQDLFSGPWGMGWRWQKGHDTSQSFGPFKTKGAAEADAMAHGWQVGEGG